MNAVEACCEYETWAAAVQRLTQQIRECGCSKADAAWAEALAKDEFPADGPRSCFSVAKETAVPRRQPDDDTRPKLNEIGPMVADCPECSRLVTLIRARKHARQRFGVAKRAIRAAGKAALRSTTKCAVAESDVCGAGAEQEVRG